MTDMKYIMLKGFKRFLLFPPSIEHNVMAASAPAPVTSAGFVRIKPTATGVEVECYGHSESLKMESNPKRDSTILTLALNPNH